MKLFSLILYPLFYGKWKKIDSVFLNTIKYNFKKNETILEVGSSSAHISYILAAQNFKIDLVEIRPEALQVAKKNFSKGFLNSTQFYESDIFKFDKKYDACWNSGLIQCFNDTNQKKFIEHLSKISNKVLLFYPDTDSGQKILNSNENNIPGFADAKEYSVSNVSTYFSENFKKVRIGTIKSDKIQYTFNMKWIYGENNID